MAFNPKTIVSIQHDIYRNHTRFHQGGCNFLGFTGQPLDQLHQPRTAAQNKFLASGPAFRVSATWSEVLHRHHGGHVHIIANLWLYLRLLKMYNTTMQMSYYVQVHIYIYAHIYIWILLYICIYIYIVHHGLGIAISWWFFTVVSLLKLYEPVLVEITHGNGIQSSWCFSSRQWLYHGHEWS